MIEDYKRNVNISEYNKSDPYKGANNGRSEYWDVMYSLRLALSQGQYGNILGRIKEPSLK
jgi:hypothetical protein